MQAVLSGQRSPQTDMYYATESMAGVATGYVIIRSGSTPGSVDVLWGDYRFIDSGNGVTGRGKLVQLNNPQEVCQGHLAGFADGSTGTQFLVWTDVQGAPSSTGLPTATQDSSWDVYSAGGDPVTEVHRDLIAAQAMPISDFGFSSSAGWMAVQINGQSSVSTILATASGTQDLLYAPCMALLSEPSAVRLQDFDIGNPADGLLARSALGALLVSGAGVLVFRRYPVRRFDRPDRQ